MYCLVFMKCRICADAQGDTPAQLHLAFSAFKRQCPVFKGGQDGDISPEGFLMRRERCNRGRDGVPEHIVTSANNRGRARGSFAATRGEAQEGSVEEVGD